MSEDTGSTFGTSSTRVRRQVLYALLRHLRPKQVLEIGSGNSTLIASAAVAADATDHQATSLRWTRHPSLALDTRPTLRKEGGAAGWLVKGRARAGDRRAHSHRAGRLSGHSRGSLRGARVRRRPVYRHKPCGQVRQRGQLAFPRGVSAVGSASGSICTTFIFRTNTRTTTFCSQDSLRSNTCSRRF